MWAGEVLPAEGRGQGAVVICIRGRKTQDGVVARMFAAVKREQGRLYLGLSPGHCFDLVASIQTPGLWVPLHMTGANSIAVDI